MRLSWDREVVAAAALGHAAAIDAACHGDAMAARIELTLRPKADVKPLDVKTAERIGRVARAEAVELDQGSAVFGFSPSETDTDVARGNIELAARFELGAHWHTRYELVGR
jgi:hypothetical protein